MESCYGGMSTRLKQRAVTEFLSAVNVKPAEIHRRLQAVYGEALPVLLAGGSSYHSLTVSVLRTSHATHIYVQKSITSKS